MSSNVLEPVFAGACVVTAVWAVTRGPVLVRELWSVLEKVFNGIKSGMYWLAVPADRRTPVQKRFNTNLRWHEIRWSIAQLEHELFDKEHWTHDVEDCVHRDCNPDFLRKINNGKIEYIPRAPKHSRGGPISARQVEPHYTCPHCNMTSFSPGDIAYKYCGNCRKFEDNTHYRFPL